MGSHGFIFLLLAASCAAAAPRPDATLAVACSVASARVYVDDAFVGRAGAGELAVPVRAGPRRVELRADGYFTAYRELAVPRGGRGRVSVELRPVPAGEPGG